MFDEARLDVVLSNRCDHEQLISTYRLEDSFIRLVIDTILQRKVHGVTFPSTFAFVVQISCPGKVIAKLVEGARHHSIGGVEGFFDSVSVMYVDVNVEHSGMKPMKGGVNRSAQYAFAKETAKKERVNTSAVRE